MHKLFGNHIQRVVLNDTPFSRVLQVFFLVPVIFSILTNGLDERLEYTLNKLIKQNKPGLFFVFGSKAVENDKVKYADV